jgi:hypothetical protein
MNSFKIVRYVFEGAKTINRTTITLSKLKKCTSLKTLLNNNSNKVFLRIFSCHNCHGFDMVHKTQVVHNSYKVDIPSL